jgi:hypothetical protein
MPTWPRAFPKHKPFECCAAWHLRKSGLYLAVYDLIGGITNGGDRDFFSTIHRVSNYFGTDYETTRRVFKGLRKMGWLRKLDDGKLYYTSHSIWLETHKAACAKRELLSWQDDTDPLVQELYGISSGKLRLFEKNVVKVRTHATDEEILRRFKAEIEASAETRKNGIYEGTSAQSCWYRVYRFLTARPPLPAVENTGYRQDSQGCVQTGCHKAV